MIDVLVRQTIVARVKVTGPRSHIKVGDYQDACLTAAAATLVSATDAFDVENVLSNIPIGASSSASPGPVLIGADAICSPSKAYSTRRTRWDEHGLFVSEGELSILSCGQTASKIN